jgi:hypothetical protein
MKRMKFMFVILAMVMALGLTCVVMAVDDEVGITVTGGSTLAITGAEDPATYTIALGAAGATIEVEELNADPRNLLYSSILDDVVTSRKITVAVTGYDDIPEGLTFYLYAADAVGGQGEVGTAQITSTSKLTLTNDSVSGEGDLITGIGNASTGTDSGNGAMITYDLAITDLEHLIEGEATLDITYTIEADS